MWGLLFDALHQLGGCRLAAPLGLLIVLASQCPSQALAHASFSNCGSQGSREHAQKLRCMGSVGSSWTRDGTRVPGIGRRILSHWGTGKAPPENFGPSCSVSGCGLSSRGECLHSPRILCGCCLCGDSSRKNPCWLERIRTEAIHSQRRVIALSFPCNWNVSIYWSCRNAADAGAAELALWQWNELPVQCPSPRSWEKERHHHGPNMWFCSWDPRGWKRGSLGSLISTSSYESSGKVGRRSLEFCQPQTVIEEGWHEGCGLLTNSCARTKAFSNGWNGLKMEKKLFGVRGTQELSPGLLRSPLHRW